MKPETSLMMEIASLIFSASAWAEPGLALNWRIAAYMASSLGPIVRGEHTRILERVAA
jgi:hypothetical protein